MSLLLPAVLAFLIVLFGMPSLIGGQAKAPC